MLQNRRCRNRGEDVLKAVKLVTKEKEYCMETYIAGIKTNSMAYAVKGADRLHNLQSAFCANEKVSQEIHPRDA